MERCSLEATPIPKRSVKATKFKLRMRPIVLGLALLACATSIRTQRAEASDIIEYPVCWTEAIC